MRKSPVKLVLASSLPLALSACGPSEPTYTVTQRVNYDDLAACVADQVPQRIANKPTSRRTPSTCTASRSLPR